MTLLAGALSMYLMKTTTTNKTNAARNFLRRSNRLAKLWAAVLAAPEGPAKEAAWKKWQKAN